MNPRGPLFGSKSNPLSRPVGFKKPTKKDIMTSLSVLRNLTSIALIACCTIGVATTHAQTYTLTDLGVLPNESVSTAAAINRKGDVAGTSGESAFRYTTTDPLMEDIGTPGVSVSRAFGINLSGQVVGDSTFEGSATIHAAIFQNGVARDLAVFGNREAFSRANDINAPGQIVGFYNGRVDGQYSRAFLTDTSSRKKYLTDLGTLGGDYAQATAINDSGFVTGNSEIPGTWAIKPDRPTHAFLWSVDTMMLDLGTLAGDFSYGTGINVNNHVVGYSTISSFDDRVHAFLHNGETMLDLGALSGASQELDHSFALGVNSGDQVVGYSFVPSVEGDAPIDPPVVGPPQQVAFLYSNGLMVDLNTQIGRASKHYRLYSATAINDKGQIAAIAWKNESEAYHAVLLTPNLDIPPSRPNTIGRSMR